MKHVARVRQFRDGEFIREWWGCLLPDGTMFMVDGDLSEEEAEAAYERLVRSMRQ